MFKRILFVFLISGLFFSVSSAQTPIPTGMLASPRVDTLPPDVAVKWMQLLYDRVREEAISAPAASRLYAYAGVTLYESLLPGMPDNFTLIGQVNQFPAIPWVQEDDIHDWAVVANAALSTVLTGLFYDKSEASAQAFADLRAEWIERRTEAEPDVIERSLAYGDLVGETILAWAMEDGYVETRGREFVPLVGPEYWIPTDAEVSSGEPYWGELRPFVLESPSECARYMNYEFSTDPDSAFYAQAQEVYDVGRNLTLEQQEIARFWVDTPGITGTPSGHWVLIQLGLVNQLEMSLNRAAEMLVKTNMVLADSFISAWWLKYYYPLLRPVTYITEYIDPRWSPYIASPNFPEYPSGHSTVSGAAAEMLTSMFGQVAFTSVNIPNGERIERSFTSFFHAANEAAISRMYGGIHFRAAIENGVDQGRCIGKAGFERVILRSIPQGG
jgi:hypothetical protein